MVAMPVVKDCCCSCSLETGSKIIAWMQIIGGVSGLISGISSEYLRSSVPECISGILSLIFGIFLLLAIRKKRPDRVNAWVVSNQIGMVLYIIIAIIATIAFMVEETIAVGVFVMIFCAINIALTFYFIVVVSSLHKEMAAGGNMGV